MSGAWATARPPVGGRPHMFHVERLIPVLTLNFRAQLDSGARGRKDQPPMLDLERLLSS